MAKDSFRFKRFSLSQDGCAMRIGTDGILLGAWAGSTYIGQPQRILDIGTGTGLLALMLAQRYPQATVLALELDSEAALTAKKNAEQSPFAERIDIVCADFLTWLSAYPEEAPHFDLIVSNPPYFKEALACPDAKRQLARHQQSLGIEQVLKSAQLLAPSGRIALICPFDQVSDLEKHAERLSLQACKLCQVQSKACAKPKRLLSEWCQRRCDTATDSTMVQSLTLMDESGNRSNEWQELSAPFYL